MPVAIIVDKVQKRKDIALSCVDLLLDKGIKKLTVAEVAKTAGVAKGSIYDYFENKEDIVFEIIRTFILLYQESINEKLDHTLSTREKIFLLFDFLLNESGDFDKHHNIYKEYVGINFSTDNEKMVEFNKECREFLLEVKTQIIKEGIAKGEIKPQARELVNGLLALEKGYLFIMWSLKKDIKKELNQVLDTLFDLIEIKKR